MSWYYNYDNLKAFFRKWDYEDYESLIHSLNTTMELGDTELSTGIVAQLVSLELLPNYYTVFSRTKIYKNYHSFFDNFASVKEYFFTNIPGFQSRYNNLIQRYFVMEGKK